jgi:hypothetical protein
MATAGGLIIGAVGLGSLYSTCVDCYCVFRKIRAFDRDYEYLASKLKTEGALLMRWGERIGLLSGDIRDIDPKLHDPWTKEAVAGVLSCIEMLLTDTEKFRTTYGLTPHGRSDRIVRTRSSSSKQGRRDSQTQTWPSDSIRPERKQVNVLRKFHWSILDQEKFCDLISELRELVQRLNELAPPSRDAPECRVVSNGISGLSGLSSGSERGDRKQHKHREGTSRIVNDTRKQDSPLAIMPPPYRHSDRGWTIHPKSHVEEIAPPRKIKVWHVEDPDNYTTYRYYRVT